ncbi:MAG: septum formation initiator family protein [Candidatus Omnitrophota bacterium]
MEKKRIGWKVILAVAILAALFLPGITKFTQLKARQVRLNSGIERLKAGEVDLRNEQEKLQKDPTYIEKVAREKLQVVNKGETIVRVEKKNGR